MHAEGPLLDLDRVELRLNSPSSSPDEAFRLGPVTAQVLGGETLAVIGLSGAGKSSLLSVMSGAARPSRGNVRIRTRSGLRDLYRGPGRDLRRLRGHLGFVHQDPFGSFNPRRRVWDQVADPLRIHRPDERRDLQRKAFQQLEAVGLTGELAMRHPARLSGGQLQRAAIARALVHAPRVVFLDEPTSSLDPSVQAELLTLLLDLRSSERAFILVSHDLAVVRTVADRLIELDQGAVGAEGSVEEQFDRPGSESLARMLRAQ